MNQKQYLTIMRRSPLFGGFTEAQCGELYQILSPVKKFYQKNETVIQDGQHVDRVGLLCGGRLCSEKFYYEGNSHIIGIQETPDLTGLETAATPSRVSPLTVTAMEDSELLFFPFDELAGSRTLSPAHRLKLMENIIHILGNKGIQQMYKIQVLSKRSLRARIMTHLSLMRQKTGQNTFCIRMNQEQFAQYLCVNRSALSFELNRMEREGLIAFKRDRYTLKQDLDWSFLLSPPEEPGRQKTRKR